MSSKKSKLITVKELTLLQSQWDKLKTHKLHQSKTPEIPTLKMQSLLVSQKGLQSYKEKKHICTYCIIYSNY